MIFWGFENNWKTNCLLKVLMSWVCGVTCKKKSLWVISWISSSETSSGKNLALNLNCRGLSFFTSCWVTWIQKIIIAPLSTGIVQYYFSVASAFCLRLAHMLVEREDIFFVMHTWKCRDTVIAGVLGLGIVLGWVKEEACWKTTSEASVPQYCF